MSRFTPTGKYLAWACAAIAVAALLPADAWATVNTTGLTVTGGDFSGGGGSSASLGSIMCNAFYNVKGVPQLISCFAYIFGAVLLVSASKSLIGTGDNPTQHPLHKAVWKFIAATGLISLPQAIGWLADTLYGSGGSGDGSWRTCMWGGNSSGSGSGLDQMMINFVSDIAEPMTLILSAACYIIGVSMIVVGFTRAGKFGSDAKSTTVPIVAHLAIGGALMVAAQTVDMSQNTLFGGSDIQKFSGMAWGNTGIDSAASAKMDAVMKAVLTYVQVIGLLAFVRGGVVLKNSITGEAQATRTAALTHIIAGSLAMNINATIKAVSNTFGLSGVLT